MRVLSPVEQNLLTKDAQALIYKYRNERWLQPRQMEELLTELVVLSQMRRTPSDAQIVTAILSRMGSLEEGAVSLESLLASVEAPRKLC